MASLSHRSNLRLRWDPRVVEAEWVVTEGAADQATAAGESRLWRTERVDRLVLFAVGLTTPRRPPLVSSLRRE